MRILIVGPAPQSKGGIATLVRNILNNANDPKYEFSMHIAYPEGSKFKKLFLVPLYTIHFLIRILIKKYDIIHIHISENWGFFRYVPIVIFSKLRKLKVIIHPNACEFDEFYQRQNSIIKRLIKETLDKSDHIFTVSEEWALVFKTISSAPVSVIYNFVEVPAKNPYKVTSNEITTSGQIGIRKGYFDLIKVIPDVVGIYPNLKFNLCGNGEVDKLIMEAKERSISEKVNITGWIANSEVKKILNDSMLFVLPTYHEGMPLAILEAMSQGIPIISTTAGGIPSLIINNVNGQLIEPGDLIALKEAIIKLIRDPELRSTISQNNYNKIKSEFSAEVNLKKIYCIYKSLILS